MTQERKICVGKITGPHGLRGLVRLRSFTEVPDSIARYPVTDEQGQSRRVTIRTAMAEEFIAELEGVTNREQAEAVRGLQLFVARDKLPPLSQREYYLADIIGLKAQDEAGKLWGSVCAMHDFGAGTLLEFKLPDGRTAMLPFRDAFVPVVDVADGFVTIAPPDDWLDNGAKPKERAS